MEEKIQIAKIVATATQTSWSQAYNAGKLFAVISLESEVPMEENSLNLLGKEILDNLEAEYFALETKDLEGIRGAVKSSQALVLGDIKCSFVVGTIINNVLYAFAKKGTVEIKREGKLGKILTGGDELDCASGFLQDKDIIILETSQFANIIPQDLLLSAIDDQPIDQISESLAPIVHEKGDAGATAIIVQYKEGLPSEALAKEGEGTAEPITPVDQNYIPSQENQAPQSIELLKKYLYFAKDRVQNIKLSTTFDRSRRTVLTVAAILLLVFIISIFLAVKRQNDQKTVTLLAQYYTPAQKKYDEGQSLLDLNQALARDSFYSAQKLLTEGGNKLDKGSSGRKQVDELLSKVNSALAQTANIKTVTPVEAASSESKILSAALKDSSSRFFAQENSDIYSLDSTGVSKNSKTIIKKDWGTAGGLGVYFGNVYVLEKEAKQIFKFVSTASEFVKTNYFTKDTTPDVSTAQGIAIDGSIWVLLKDGTVLKFTRGSSDNLSLTGLDKAFSSPTRIFTNADSDNIYILDNGNSRVIVFDKKGAYKAQYQSSILKTAKDLEVLEKSKKILFLSGTKIFRIDL